MVFNNYKGKNNAETTFAGGVSASATTWILKTGEGALFGTAYPFLLTAEKFNAGSQIIGREIVKVTGSPATDQITVVRQFEECVQDETTNPKVLSNGPQTFDSGDKISLYQTNLDNEDIKAEIVRLEDDKLDTSTYDLEKNVFGASSQLDDDYVITDSSLTSYNDGQPIRFRVDVANTGSATLEINSLGPKALKKEQGTADLITGDILADGIVTAVYNSVLDVFQFVGQLATVVSGTVPDASTSVKGIIEIATDTEAKALSDTTRAIVPSSLKAVLKDFVFVTSTFTTGTSSFSTVYNHSLGKVPTKFDCFFNAHNIEDSASRGFYNNGIYGYSGIIGNVGISGTDAMGMLVSDVNDWFKITVSSITSTQFTLNFQEVVSAGVVYSSFVIKVS